MRAAPPPSLPRPLANHPAAHPRRQANNSAPSSSMFADDESVIEQLVGQLGVATKDLPKGFKLHPITFEKVGRGRGGRPGVGAQRRGPPGCGALLSADPPPRRGSIGSFTQRAQPRPPPPQPQLPGHNPDPLTHPHPHPEPPTPTPTPTPTPPPG
jgi:hypothetical protein